MKGFGISGKLAFSSACILVSLGITVTWYSHVQLRSMLYHENMRRVEAQALNWIQANTAYFILGADPGVLERRVKELKEREGIAYAILSLVDQQGRRLAAGEAPHKLRWLKSAPAVAAVKSKLSEMEDGAGRRYFELEAPIAVSGTGMSGDLEAMFRLAAREPTLGAVRVAMAQGELEGQLQSFVRRNAPLYAALVLLAVVINVALARRMARPIASMARAANRIAAGDLSGRVGQGANLRDEVGVLVRNFNQMAGKLAENREEMDLLYAGLEEKVRERTLELEQANRRLQQLDETKSRFLSTVSHELRTPLTSIKAYAEILLDSNPEPATRMRFLDIINTQSDRLSRLISDLLDLAKIESGAVNWRLAERDLRAIVSEAVAPLAAMAEERGVHLEVIVSEPQPVIADADRIQQVITNLVSNAVKFSPAGGSIWLRLETRPSSGPQNGMAGDYACVVVEDNGPGIPPEDHQRVFDRFYRGTRPGVAEGTGLGLTISREIVLYHKGEIWVESEPGQGSSFYFTLPRVKAGDAEAAASARTEENG